MQIYNNTAFLCLFAGWWFDNDSFINACTCLPSRWSAHWLTDWFVCGLILAFTDSLIQSLTDLLIHSPVHCFTDSVVMICINSFVCWVTDSPIHLLTDLLYCWLTDSFIHWLTDVIYVLTDSICLLIRWVTCSFDSVIHVFTAVYVTGSFFTKHWHLLLCRKSLRF